MVQALKMERLPLRDNRGAAVISLCLVLSLFMIFIIFFIFDMNRLQMAQRQVNALCDAAALAGTAMLTSTDLSYEDGGGDKLYTTQLAAEQYAKNMLALGTILGMQCYDPSAGSAVAGGIPVSQVASSAALNNTSPGQLNVWVQVCSPLNNYAVVAPGNSTGRALYIQAAYGYIPFLSILGINSVTLPASSTGSLQKLYVMLAFDCSGSMDDNTVVSFVYRRWTQSPGTSNGTSTIDDGAADQANNNKGQYVYTVVGNPGSTGQLWEYSGLNYGALPCGTALNVLPPQNLDYLGIIYGNTYNGSYAGANTYFSGGLAFDMAIADYVPWQAGQLTGVYNSSYTTYPASGSGFAGPYSDNYFGTPPGNCRVKYGWAPSGATYGGQAGGDISDVTKSMNIFNTAAPNYAPGLGTSPGYYYYPNGPTSANGSANPNDGNLYFYDPYSMPQANTNTSYAAFTDLVANITSLNFPVNQPLYGPATFSGFSQTFSGDSYTIPVAESNWGGLTNEITGGHYETDPDLAGQTFKFPNLAYVVEASRGNLDLDYNGGGPINYYNALLGYGSNFGGSHPAVGDCQTGYQKAYQRLAMFALQPFATAVDGATRFFQNLVATSCVNFGLVCFSVPAGSTPNYFADYMWNHGWGADHQSLNLCAPWNTTKSTPGGVLGAYVYAPPQFWGGFNINPNFWMTSPWCVSGRSNPSGPGGQPTGQAYLPGLNNAGPMANTCMQLRNNTGGGAGFTCSNANTMWAFNTGGFFIPMSLLWTGNGPSQSYSLCAGDDYFTMNQCMNMGHARPLYDTAGLPALQIALYNLTNISKLNSLIGLGTGLPLPNQPGSKSVIVFFTDGIPTDDSTPYSSYAAIASQAQGSGVPIYAIGLALNDNIKTLQYPFLKIVANKGACGSQFFQVTSNSGLTSTFTGIARQLAQCQH